MGTALPGAIIRRPPGTFAGRDISPTFGCRGDLFEAGWVALKLDVAAFVVEVAGDALELVG
ncbi:MAG TPA: hypothetical protein VFC07_12610 [Verrucomicrobiae bacterium]|nr:hypothetical protein [Verrucomicrobiae bacterium]